MTKEKTMTPKTPIEMYLTIAHLYEMEMITDNDKKNKKKRKIKREL